MKRIAIWASVVAVLGMASSSTALVGDGADPSTGSYGYVVTMISPAIYKNADEFDCPEGMANTLTEAYLATQTPAERVRLQLPENVQELDRKRLATIKDAKGRDICVDPEVFNHPPQRQTQSKVAYGLDLDGRDGGPPAPNTCAHKNFRGPNGETGIDNEYFRAVACNRFFRGKGDGIGDQINGYRRLWSMGINTAVIMLRGVDDFRNDDHVEIMIASSPEAPPVDPAMKIVDGGSFAITPNPRWRNLGTGRIRNGVLTTDPMDMNIFIHWSFIDGEMNLKRARFQLNIQPDGSLKGIVGAYRPVSNAADRNRGGGLGGVARAANLECAAIYSTYKLLADGDRDPKTGQCASISIAMDVAAIPAFLFDKGVMVAGRPRGAIKTAAKRP